MLFLVRIFTSATHIFSVMSDVRKVFEDRDTDNSGLLDMSEMSAAMKALNVKLSEDEVKSLFEVRTNSPK